MKPEEPKETEISDDIVTPDFLISPRGAIDLRPLQKGKEGIIEGVIRQSLHRAFVHGPAKVTAEDL